MRPGRLLLVLLTVAAAGTILVRPGEVLPVASRFVVPLFAQQQDRPAVPEPSLPDYVPVDRQLSIPMDVGTKTESQPEAAVSAAAADRSSGGSASSMIAPVRPDNPVVTGLRPETGTSSSIATATIEPAASPAPVSAALAPAAQSPSNTDATEPDAAPARRSVITQIEPIFPASPAAAGEPPAARQPVIAAKTLFGAVKGPAPIAARAIGSYARGCLAGAVALPVDGPAWQAMWLSRNRNWGHPKLIALVEQLATDSQKLDGWPGLLVGDIAQPRGGPMLTGHASHQIGLDADIWLTPMPNRKLSHQEREEINATSMLDSTDIAVDPKIFTDSQVKLIKRAASYAQVERVLVHPAIKKALCQAAGTDRKWLGKVRPIAGHYYHFHIRMACPPGSAGCTPQKPPTGDDGCTKEVDEWLARVAPPKGPAPPPPPGYKPPPPKPPLTIAELPSECTAVLERGPDGVTVPSEARVTIAGKIPFRDSAALRPHVRAIRAAARK